MAEAAPVPVPAPKKKADIVEIFKNAARRAGQGGLAGAAAMGINECS
jgi:hypothetical protein